MPATPEQTAEMTMTAAMHQLDVDAGIFGRLAVAADHVHVAAEARVGQHQVADQQEQRGHEHEARNGRPPLPEPRTETRSGTA